LDNSRVGQHVGRRAQHDVRRRLTEVSLFPSFEDRDGTVASGMEGGARESLDRLDDLLTAS